MNHFHGKTGCIFTEKAIKRNEHMPKSYWSWKLTFREGMAKIRTEFLEKGMVLGEEIHSQDGRSVMQSDLKLDEEKIELLHEVGKVYVEVKGVNEEEIDRLYQKGASEDDRKTINQLHTTQFSLCVDEDRYVQELKKISLRSLYIMRRL